MTTPARNDPILPTPDQVGGWTTEALKDWLGEAVPALVYAEKRTEEARLAVGLVLWAIRQRVPEGEFGTYVADVAWKVDAGASTIQRWRKAAEQHWGLQPPPVAAARYDGQRRRRESERLSHERQSSSAALPAAAPAPAAPPETVAAPPPAVPVPAPAAEPAAAAPSGPAAAAAPGGQAAARAAVEACLLFTADQLRDAVDRERLAALVARCRLALTQPTVRGDCPHPKAKEQKLGYLVQCGQCGEKLR